MEQVACAVSRGNGEVGPCRVTDEQRVAREHDLLVLHDEGAVLRPVTRRVHHADAHRSDLQDVSVGERRERVLGLGERVDRDGQAVLEREPAMPGEVIGVRVGFEDAPDLDTRFGRRLHVLLDGESGVDDNSLTGARVADEIRATAQVLIDELPEQHEAERTTGFGRIWLCA